VKVLIVEDDLKVARFLARVLGEEGFVTDHCADGSEAIEQASAGVYDLVLLDWMLPGKDGLSVCREIRRRGFLGPIMMLTGRGATTERVLGLDTGADDYLVKPFEVEELVARVRALCRRSTGFPIMRSGDLEIDRAGRRALLGGTPIGLTSREFALLLHLMHNAGKVVGRASLLAHVWETKFDPGSNLVEVHVSRLREKLGDHAWMIETVRGAGYRLRSEKPRDDAG
jgi:DNA-binding response OmpR family regulator